MTKAAPEMTFAIGIGGQPQMKTVDALFLYGVSSTIDAALREAEMSARITCPTASVVVGFQKVHAPAVEFKFRSTAIATNLLRTPRLFDLALAYVRGDMDIFGPLNEAVAALDAVNKKTDHAQTFWEYLTFMKFRVLKVLSRRVARNFESLEHYEMPAKAYELFLDEAMQYTCGVYETGTEDLGTAQRAKFKLIQEWYQKHAGRLYGKRHLDIGCGWGGLLAYCSDNFGTKSVGNTNCNEQRQYAENRLGCEIIFGDFEDISDRRPFDLVTIIGMVEHLTPSRRRELLSIVRKRLAPGGLVYLQCIAKPRVWIGGDIFRFAEQFVFPGHFIDTPENTSMLIQRCGFEILEFVEHGPHYGHTTAAWVTRMERNRNELVALMGEQQYRMFSGYLAFASRLFSTDRGSLTRYMLRAI